MDEVEKVYRQFWKPIVAKFGFVNMRQVKRELFDYYNFMEETAKVYDHVTGGRISKVNTCADAVIGEADARLEEWIEEAVKEHLEEQAESGLTKVRSGRKNSAAKTNRWAASPRRKIWQDHH